MKIAIIGTGNVGSALARNWVTQGHEIQLGVRDTGGFKGQELREHPRISVHPPREAVQAAEVVLFAIPAPAMADITRDLGDLAGKVLIDATNAIVQGPDPYPTGYHALVDAAPGAQVVKCFNSTGFENMINPVYDGEGIDMFMAGASAEAKAVAQQLARDAGFGACWDFGGEERVELLEKFALSWINLAIFQKHGRGIAFKVLQRDQ
ncbi:MAG: NAD(P)-binding domain-containing protein [Bacteroidota bacterium]